MKNQKGFIQTPLLIVIIIGVFAISGGGYFGVRQYQNYQVKKINKEQELKKAQDLLVSQQKIAEEEKNNIEKQKQEEQDKQKLEMEKLKQEVESLKNKPPQIIVKESQPKEPQIIVKEVPQEKPKTIDLPSIINEWRLRVAHITCEWHYSDTGDIYLRKAGSGLALVTAKDGIVILTNAHVITDQGKYSPWICSIRLPEDNNIFSVSYGTDAFNMSFYDLDWGTIKITGPDEYITNLTSPRVRYCPTKASLGDAIVILGYPGVGSQTDITATEGIISGYDGDYFITSAKVEQGNSGGVAILLKDNCYLGIPSFASVGGIESLARILDANVFVAKK